MVKAYWLAVALAVGIALGLILGRSGMDQPGAAPGAPSPPQSTPAAHAPRETGPVVSAAPRDLPVAARRGSPVRESVADVSATTPAQLPASPVYSGYSEPIEVGPVFRKQFEASAAQGFRNPVAEAHQQIERELRDDSWAYPIEADIQNSLMSETSMGNFKLEHIECRATMCELRLSGKGEDQALALSNWSKGVSAQPWSSRLVLSSSSMTRAQDDVNQLMIFTTPLKPPPQD
jgi:hypothetical protein